jgi:hypothetical protein
MSTEERLKDLMQTARIATATEAWSDTMKGAISAAYNRGVTDGRAAERQRLRAQLGLEEVK